MTNDEDGVFNAYRYPLDGSTPSQLTQSTTDTIFGISWFPEDDRILYTADQGGNELNHLFVRELDGTIKDLTEGEKPRRPRGTVVLPCPITSDPIKPNRARRSA